MTFDESVQYGIAKRFSRVTILPLGVLILKSICKSYGLAKLWNS
jgi:hypothetical protein